MKNEVPDCGPSNIKDLLEKLKKLVVRMDVSYFINLVEFMLNGRR